MQPSLPSLPRRCTASSCLLSTGSPGPFLQSCCPASPRLHNPTCREGCPTCTTSHCSTSWGSCWPIPPACSGPSAWQLCPPASLPLPLVGGSNTATPSTASLQGLAKISLFQHSWLPNTGRWRRWGAPLAPTTSPGKRRHQTGSSCQTPSWELEALVANREAEKGYTTPESRIRR